MCIPAKLSMVVREPYVKLREHGRKTVAVFIIPAGALAGWASL
jgi:hypothetical protein